jgi:methionyl-tRNA formyltransferase
MTNIIFMGSPDFAVPTLEALHNQYGVKAIVTVPDKPKGRGLQMQASAVKEFAIAHNIPVLQPESLKDETLIENLKSYNPDIFCVVAFRILPREVFTIPKIASFNIHGSLLPKYRGAAPINRAIIVGEKTTGVTSFILQDKVDTGNILFKKEIAITDSMTAGELYESLKPMAADLALETCEALLSNNYNPLKQDNSLATPAPKIFREDCKIDFTKHSLEVKNLIHGVSPHPGAWCNFGELTFKILRCELAEDLNLKTGEYKVESKEMKVQCENSSIKLLEVQVQGKRVMNIQDFLSGFRGEKIGIFG